MSEGFAVAGQDSSITCNPAQTLKTPEMPLSGSCLGRPHPCPHGQVTPDADDCGLPANHPAHRPRRGHRGASTRPPGRGDWPHREPRSSARAKPGLILECGQLRQVSTRQAFLNFQVTGNEELAWVLASGEACRTPKGILQTPVPEAAESRERDFGRWVL